MTDDQAMQDKAPETGVPRGHSVRHERRFEAQPTTRTRWAVAGVWLSGLVLGAGVSGQWGASMPVAFAPWLLVFGAVLLAIAAGSGSRDTIAVRVGDAGLALERTGHPLARLEWCEIRSITVKDGALVVTGLTTLKFPMVPYTKAVAWVVREAKSRRPTIVEIAEPQLSSLPQANDADGTVLDVEMAQVTGKRCRASGKLITFERDARLCARCGEVYHRDDIPADCLTCEAPLSDPRLANAG